KELVNTIIYTGTHDNSTLMGWYWSLNTWNRKLLKRFFKANDVTITHKMLQYSLNCNASYVIFPAQDILGLGDYARMNFPSTIGSPNWEWKMANLAGLKAEATWLGAAVAKSGR
nr:4-alpha-glucanotransferase [Burkholderiales bacterium]